MEYFLTVLLIMISLVLSLVAIRVVIIGFIGFFINLVAIFPVAINPTVIMGVGYNITDTGTQIITLTQEISELRWIAYIVIVLNICCILVGLVRNLET